MSEDIVKEGKVHMEINDVKNVLKNDSEAKTFFISSGTLNSDVVPKILRQYLYLHSFLYL
jgi:hypothetical protein